MDLLTPRRRFYEKFSPRLEEEIANGTLRLDASVEFPPRFRFHISTPVAAQIGAERIVSLGPACLLIERGYCADGGAPLLAELGVGDVLRIVEDGEGKPFEVSLRVAFIKAVSGLPIEGTTLLRERCTVIVEPLEE